jgi:hypothetical protein
VSVDLFRFRGELDIIHSKLPELVSSGETKSLLVGCSFTMNLMVSANLIYRLGSDGSRNRRRISLPRNGSKKVVPLELRQLKMPLDGRSLGAKGRAAKRVAEMVTQEYVAHFDIQAFGATNTNTVFGRLYENLKSIGIP